MRISKLIENKIKRKIVNKNELKTLFFKYLIVWLLKFKFLLNSFLALVYNKFYFLVFKKSYFTSVKNICLISGRTRSIIAMYKLSRIYFNSFVSLGYLPG